MVKRVFDLVYKEVRGLHQAAYVLGFFALGSQVLAIVRDRMLAHEFGAGLELDVYYAAFRIPDVLYVLFASTLSIYVLIPFISEKTRAGDDAGARAILSSVFSAFLVVYILLSLLLSAFAPVILPYLFPGLEGQMETLILTTRILLLQPLLLGISSLFGVVTQLGHRFVLYAISPLLYNLGIIVGIMFFYPVWGTPGLGYGVVLGALGHVLVQMPFVYNSALAIVPTVTISWRDVARVLVVSLPRAATLALSQIVLLALLGIASAMTVGSVSVFQFAFNLQSVPLAIIGASYSIAAFPYLADLFAQRRMEDFGFHITTALRHIIFWSIPAAGLLIVLRAHVVRVILGSGDFTWADTRLTAAVLAVLTLSLVAQAGYLLLVRAFYAGGNTRIPLLVTLAGAVCAVFGTYLLRGWYVHTDAFREIFLALFRISDVPGGEILVVALGYTLAIWLQTVILGVCAFVYFKIPSRWLIAHTARAVVASLCGGIAAYGTLNVFAQGINETSFLGILIQGFSGGVVGVSAIIVTYLVLRSPELSEIYQSFHSKVFKTDVVAPQEDIL
jgi:putative peptidoglycan lipid II flippase